ncbi:MAG: aminoacetone oxidase family FAD-binding enzyme [Candidatus Zixiibacteriota bacterium]|nr:MAG: aminoacetone oxidase family FAD-binding enzyme [candidate division Zixibacteria bacterium]
MSKKKVIVVGGGASGLMAAGIAAENRAETIIFEKKLRPGRKLRITGKGRCNLTNIIEIQEFLNHFASGKRFLRQAFARFFANDLVDFFNELGIKTDSERGGRVFPLNNDAREVVDALDAWVRRCGVTIRTRAGVESLLTKDGRIIGVQVPRETKSVIKPPYSNRSRGSRDDSKLYRADAVIVATGGLSYPATGSTGDGYRLAGDVGHTIIPTRPSLVPIKTAGDVAQQLQGVSLKNVNASLYVDNKKRDQRFGEMLFTHFGLSGPIILSLSRQVVEAVQSKKKVEISFDLKPALDEQKLNKRLLRDLDKNGRQKFKTLLKELLPRKLIPVCYQLTDINPDKIGNQISADERRRLGRWLKDFRLEVNGFRSYDEAIITAGGISTKEINPRTMESRIIGGLYFAGEIIDIDADTGGYNLQAAFSTGWLAGQSASK